MAAAKDFIPSKDADLQAFTERFALTIGANPVNFGITAAIATAYSGKQSEFKLALQAATNPATRGSRTVYLKDQAKKSIVTLTRQVAKQITGTMSVTNDQRQQLGLPIPTGHRTPQPAPDVAPVLNVLSTDGRTVTLELKQTKTRRGRPAGTTGAMVFTASTPIGVSAPAFGDPAWQFNQLTSLMTVQVDCGSSATGDTVHFIASYLNSKNESGPVAKAISVALPAGGVLPAQAQRMTLRAA